MRGHAPRDPNEFVLRGQGITSEFGDLEVIGTLLQRFGRLVRILGGGEPLMERFVFAGSAHIWLRPSDEEIARAEREIERVDRLREEASADADERIAKAYAEAATDVQIGLTLAADLLEAPAEEAPRRAVEFGADVAVAYKSLATGSAASQVSLIVPRLDVEEEVLLTPAKAELVREALRDIEEPIHLEVEAYGVLSMADALHSEFALRLDPRARPEALRGKRIVRGTYTPQMEDVIREQALWDREVLATIRVERDAYVSTSSVRKPVYTLIGVEARPY